MQDILGGSSGSSGAQNTSSSGFSLLPQSIQNAFTGLATTAQNTLNPNGTPNTSLTSLPQLSAPATTALGQIQNQDFAITPQSIASDISEQMNPYNSSVIGQIENAQNGTESQLNSYLSDSGTFGSNRGAVASSDISNNAANQIGSFLNGEYNTALGNALTTIPSNQAQSAQGAVQGGLTQQQQQYQQQQAPVTALSQLAALMGVLPQTGGSTSQGTSSSQQSSSTGLLPTLFSGS